MGKSGFEFDRALAYCQHTAIYFHLGLHHKVVSFCFGLSNLLRLHCCKYEHIFLSFLRASNIPCSFIKFYREKERSIYAKSLLSEIGNKEAILSGEC